MKAADFEYVRADSLTQVCELLAKHGADCKIIAGGQTLVPLMVMRMARPDILVDINHVPELTGIAVEGDWLVIKACTRQRAVERSPEVQRAVPLLAKALTFVGHTQTRNRGTVGGSLVNADPSAEISLVATALDAVTVAMGPDGTVERPAADFFDEAMATAIGDDECLVEARFPVWSASRLGIGFHELSSRASDFAVASAAAQLALDSKGGCEKAALAIGGVSGRPLRCDEAVALLEASALEDSDIDAAMESVRALLQQHGDEHADPDYRRHAALTMARRALLDARDMAANA